MSGVKGKSLWESFVECCIPDCCISDCCLPDVVMNTDEVARKSFSKSESNSQLRTARVHNAQTPTQQPQNADTMVLQAAIGNSAASALSEGAVTARGTNRHRIYASSDLTSPEEFFASEAARDAKEKASAQPPGITNTPNS